MIATLLFVFSVRISLSTMATSALQERRKRLVNRVGRHLPCNNMQVVSDFANVATKASYEPPHHRTTAPLCCSSTSSWFLLAYSHVAVGSNGIGTGRHTPYIARRSPRLKQRKFVLATLLQLQF